jgi:hypothetical protein
VLDDLAGREVLEINPPRLCRVADSTVIATSLVEPLRCHLPVG